MTDLSIKNKINNEHKKCNGTAVGVSCSGNRFI